jgi:hypothetical protein
MKTLARIIIAVAAVLLMGFLPGSSADARGGHGGGHVGIGVWLGPGWWGPYYAPYYYPYPYYQEPPIVIEQQPEVYVQPAPQTEQQPVYWYYCRDPQGYYPYVKQCPGGWMRVVPTPPSQPPAPSE